MQKKLQKSKLLQIETSKIEILLLKEFLENIYL
jgi:hypothetical protein